MFSSQVVAKIYVIGVRKKYFLLSYFYSYSLYKYITLWDEPLRVAVKESRGGVHIRLFVLINLLLINLCIILIKVLLSLFNFVNYIGFLLREILNWIDLKCSNGWVDSFNEILWCFIYYLGGECFYIFFNTVTNPEDELKSRIEIE